MHLMKTKKSSAHSNHHAREQCQVEATAVAVMLDSVRATLLELGGMSTCVATLQKGGDHLDIVCRLPLSGSHIKKIRCQVLDQANQLGLAVGKAEAFPVFINGRPSRHGGKEELPEQPLSLRELAAFPLCTEGRLSGLVQVSMLEPTLSLRRVPIFEKIVAQAPAAAVALSWHLAGQRNRFQQALCNTLDGVVLCDDEGHLLFANERAHQLVDADDIHSNDFSFDKPAFAAVREVIAEARRHRLHLFNRVIRAGKKDDRLLGVRVQLIRDHTGRDLFWQTGLYDITTNWLADQLRSTLAIASHELHTPLLSIKNTIELLLEQEVGALNTQQKHCLHIIDEDIDRSRRLLKDLITFSSFDAVVSDTLERRRYVRLDLLAKKVAGQYRLVAEQQGLTIRVQLPAQLSSFPGDRDRMMQLLVNLVENAIKFTSAGGEIVIGAEEQESAVLGWVRDTGIGMDAAEAATIFERSEQFDDLPQSAPRGHGLGLRIAREIVEFHHGRIWVESKLGRGSIFYFSVPKS